MSQSRRFWRDSRQSIMVEVEVDKECEGEETRCGREVLDV